MFTYATRDFGSWRTGHRSRRRYAGAPTAGLVMALSGCAFVAWLIFFLALKLRTDFFLLENSGLTLAKVPLSQDAAFFPQRPAAAALGVVKTAPGAFRFIFDTGEVFQFPAEQDKVVALLRLKTNAILMTAMLTMSDGQRLSRVQLWPDVSVSFAELQGIMEVLARFGFDDFDFAFEAE